MHGFYQRNNIIDPRSQTTMSLYLIMLPLYAFGIHYVNVLFFNIEGIIQNINQEILHRSEILRKYMSAYSKN